MKIFLSFLLGLLLLSAPLAAQSLDSCGLDNQPFLTAPESAWLNHDFAHIRDTFDFMGKKIAFVTGPSGSYMSSKVAYFQDVKAWQSNGSTVSDALYVLTAAEKMRSGGYDAIVVYWAKFFSHHRRNKVIRLLGAVRAYALEFVTS